MHVRKSDPLNMEGIKQSNTWKIAECSESAGKILTPYFLARGSTNGPPAIKVSLFARAMSFPASIAATVGWNHNHSLVSFATASVFHTVHREGTEKSMRRVNLCTLRPAQPTIPVTTVTASGCLATCHHMSNANVFKRLTKMMFRTLFLASPCLVS